MQGKYFSDCEDMDMARAKFRKLAFQLHPDHGGIEADFVAMVAEFQNFQTFTWNNAGQAKWGTGYKPKDFTLSPEAMERLRAVLRYPDLVTEIIGTWIWVSGDTRKYKDQLKEMKFRWSPKKAAWNYHSEAWVKRHHGEYSMDELRNMHGTREQDQAPDDTVAA